ncbi:ATP-binding protein [Desulfurococcaceae archaeon MEX13E-LK6-19]|nr:ATP-binding protein [Desulfurococcaceae archaeon MEX13E-LK6-19]
MKLIGLIASGSTTAYAPVIIWDQVEHYAKEEQLVLVDDTRRNIKYLGVLRLIKRFEPFLDTKKRTSYVDNPDLVETGTLPHSSGYVSIIGVVSGNGLSEAQLPPNPGSRVYVIESPSDLELGLGEGLVVGVHKYSGIEIPLDARGIPYHVGVVGATGTGKSRLVKAFIDEVLAKTNYNVIVFDHTGMDYTRFYKEHVVEGSRIVLDISLITDMILYRTGLNRNTYEPYVMVSLLAYLYDYLRRNKPELLAEISGTGSGQQKLVPQIPSFDDFLNNIDYSRLQEILARENIVWDINWFKKQSVLMLQRMRAKDSSKIRLGIAIDLYLGKQFFESLSKRDLLPQDIVDKATSDRLVVIDLSTEDLEARRYIVSSVINELWRRIEEKREPINTLVVIDEAHNYACRNCGASHRAITRIAREGRKWGLGVLLATQRIIDIDPEIRGNINTWFFSKLQTPGDFNELKGYMDMSGISENTLAILGKREFFVAGLMNPFKMPILVKVKEVE